jgi:hypothetical protein
MAVNSIKGAYAALAVVARLIGLIMWAASKIQCCRWFVGSISIAHYFEQILRLDKIQREYVTLSIISHYMGSERKTWGRI